jgi:hypothetical protein
MFHVSYNQTDRTRGVPDDGDDVGRRSVNFTLSYSKDAPNHNHAAIFEIKSRVELVQTSIAYSVRNYFQYLYYIERQACLL